MHGAVAHRLILSGVNMTTRNTYSCLVLYGQLRTHFLEQMSDSSGGNRLDLIRYAT